MSPRRSGRYPGVKRALDIVAAATGLVVATPVLAAVALVVRRDLGRPVLFRQVRPGRGGQPFELVKFRTMRSASDAGPATDGERLTRVGRWLRSTSLDELPTLWNVLRGQMSLIGPRPLLVEYLARYDPVQARRHEVRPGVTGLAQVRGRNALSWEAKFAADVEYVDHLGPVLDARIALATLRTVLTRHGISAPGEATMSLFTGSRPSADPARELGADQSGGGHRREDAA